MLDVSRFVPGISDGVTARALQQTDLALLRQPPMAVFEAKHWVWRACRQSKAWAQDNYILLAHARPGLLTGKISVTLGKMTASMGRGGGQVGFKNDIELLA